MKKLLPLFLLPFIAGFVTTNIREESERLLKNETAITAAGNKQILAQQEALKRFKEMREQAAFDREFYGK